LKQEESEARLQRGRILKMATQLLSVHSFRDSGGRLNTSKLVADILSLLSENAISDYYKLIHLSNDEASFAKIYFRNKQLELKCTVEIGSVAETRDSNFAYEAIFRRKQ